MRASYREYPEYKGSGIEWVGSIPKHWDVFPVFAVCGEKEVKNSQGEESNVLSLSYGRIIPRNVEDNYGLMPESFNTYQIVLPGDVILRLTDLQNDKRSLRVGLVKEKGIITSAYLCLKSGDKFLPEYLYSLLHSYDTTKVFYGMGGGLRQSMKFADMRRMPLLTPALEEQQAIVAYISHETAKIDRLIEKQQQLIELLKEKRQAVISHAVTKGLDPNVKMKDSGVEWLGKTPVHWKVLPLKRAVTLQRGHDLPTDSRIEGTYPVVSSGGVISAHSEPRARGPGIVTGRYGTIGEFYYVDSDYWPLNTSLYSSDTHGNVVKYLWYMLQSMKHLFVLNSLKSAVPGVDRNDLHPERIVLPADNDEQQVIVEYLERKLEQIAGIEKKATDQIELLMERRTALISAAVTGKIDVRNWRADTQTAA